MNAHSNRLLLERFYCAFENRDWNAMAECYANEARFSDPVFVDLDAAGARAMWRMLLARAEDLSVEAHVVCVDEREGEVHWIARYTFGPTGRGVENRIRARFEFANGRIVKHVDHFDLWGWSCQAFGWSGVLFGWSPMFRANLRHAAQQRLDRFRSQNSGNEAPLGSALSG